MKKRVLTISVGLAAVLCALVFVNLRVSRADEFTKEDLDRWNAEYMSVVKQGRELWTSGTLGTNGVACAQCHPNGANTHPETYPKFQQQLGRVVPLRDMINWCLQNPLEGKVLEANDPRMVAIEAYLAYERRGVAIDPGKH
ncbi:MAG: cytochrome C [Candidatus Hydrogenedentes bacterium]|nr:cytochrome C [Candidatus Hydrogenedentota bacterium]